MKIQENNSGGLTYLTFPDTVFENTVHGIFTRKGGVSPEPFQSLNLSTSTGDSNENIHENRNRIFETIGRNVDSLFDVWQVHSNKVVCTDFPRNREINPIKADAILTNNPAITLLMRFADCVPILLFDPVKKVVGIVHAGWERTLNKIVQETVREASTRYGCAPEDMAALIGPCIGAHHYEVGLELAQRFAGEFPDSAGIINRVDHRVFLDLGHANGWLLTGMGVNHILFTNLCTACDTSNWFSHRAEKGKTGRFGVVIALKE